MKIEGWDASAECISYKISVLGVFSRPLARFLAHPYLPAGVRAVGSWVLGYAAWSHHRLSLSRGRGVYSVFHVWVSCASGALAGAGLSWPHSLRSVARDMEGSGCERSGVRRSGGCHQPWQGCRSFGG